MKQPKVGDTVIIEGIVREVKDIFVYISTQLYEIEGWSPFGPGIDFRRIKEIIRRPIEVGNTVHKIGDVLTDFHYTVLAVHGSNTPLIMPYGPTRHWVVCAHGDDMPQVFNVGDLECVD